MTVSPEAVSYTHLLAEVETVRGNKVFCAEPGLRDVLPRKAERLPVSRVHLAIKQGQPCPTVQRLTGNTQPLEVSHHIGLHPFQAGAGLRDPFPNIVAKKDMS